MYIAYVVGSPMVSTVLNSTASMRTADANSSLTMLPLVWDVWPIFLVIGLIVWAYLFMSRRESVTYEGQ